MALYIGLNNITGKIRLSKGEVVDLTDEYLINDLLKANYIKPFTELNTNSKDVQGAINELLAKINTLSRESISLVPKGNKIDRNEDINTIKYLKVGSYYCDISSVTGTLINCPTISAFMMFVFSPLNSVYDIEETSNWVYRNRIIMNIDGAIYIQSASSSAEAGKFTYGEWKQLH